MGVLVKVMQFCHIGFNVVLDYSVYLDDQSKAYIFQDRRRPWMAFVERTGMYL